MCSFVIGSSSGSVECKDLHKALSDRNAKMMVPLGLGDDQDPDGPQTAYKSPIPKTAVLTLDRSPSLPAWTPFQNSRPFCGNSPDGGNCEKLAKKFATRARTRGVAARTLAFDDMPLEDCAATSFDPEPDSRASPKVGKRAESSVRWF
jgi:hypothetical protein